MPQNKETIDELLTRGVAEVIGKESLREKLLSEEKIHVKLGIDPTSPNIHIGRAVLLLKLADFQRLGHKVTFIVGDFTGQIGDTSDKESERPMLGAEEVKSNMASYLEQAGKILDMQEVAVRYNSQWLGAMTLREVSEYADAFSVAEFISRENIRKRLKEGKRVSLREMLYPLMQGYDSVAIEADLEIGGSDQRFNLLAGRTLQSALKKKPQACLTMNLMLGTDGRKMSSSWGNTINVLDPPHDMFGKVMSLPDHLIFPYFIHCTRLTMSEISRLETEIKSGGNPRDAKLRLAREIVTLYHTEDTAEESERHFIETFSKGHVPENILTVSASDGDQLVDVLVRADTASSRGDARRKIEQGGVEIDGKKVEQWTLVLNNDHDGTVVKVGKKDFFRLVF
jgi:tyrosyl-tRNA synthetase